MEYTCNPKQQQQNIELEIHLNWCTPKLPTLWPSKVLRGFRDVLADPCVLFIAEGPKRVGWLVKVDLQYTPPETNTAAENRPSNHPFSGQAVSFLEGSLLNSIVFICSPYSEKHS